jgi:hypothetical protein
MRYVTFHLDCRTSRRGPAMRTSENGLWFGLFLNVVPKTLARPMNLP